MKARIYTKTGDKGQTSLVGGSRVSKTEPRLVAYGTLDELNSVLGVIRAHLGLLGVQRTVFENHLQNVQNNLFNMGSRLACENEKLLAQLPDLSADALSVLENDMDAWEAELPPLKEFILPGGSVPAAHAHVARTVCRRAERQVLRLRSFAEVSDSHVIYLNRLSDWLFLLARKFNHLLGQKDVTWSKG
jgi:cob(I)alamin adenosyltransferase